MSKSKPAQSEQASKLIDLAKARGLIDGGSGGGNDGENKAGGDGEDFDEDLPQIELPGDGTPLIGFARRLADVLKGHGMFRRDVAPVVVNTDLRRLEIIKPDGFRSWCEKHCIFYRMKFGESGPRQVVKSMNKEVALGTMSSWDFWPKLPLINRINQVRMPVMRKDASVNLLPEGYDEAHQTYTLPSEVIYDEKMTIEQAKQELDDLLSEFPFGDRDKETRQSRSKSVTVAAMLTMFCGGVVPRKSARPGFMFTANSPRSGKSLLAKMSIIPSCGSVSPTSFAKKDEELKKVLDSAVMAAKPYLLFDNIKGLIESESLEAFMSSGEWEGRKLGGNDLFTAENPTVIFMTGNQATTSTDIQGRCLFVELFVEEADPQSRQVAKVIDEEWLARPENRSRILSALWAMVKHWAAIAKDERPRAPRRLVGFEAWSNIVPSIILAAGYTDPLAPAQLDAAGDTELEAMTCLVAALLDEPSEDGNPYTMRACEFGELVAAARDKNLFDWMLADGDDLSPKSKSALGKLFKRFAGRLFVTSDGRRVQFGSRGKQRHRRYTVTLLPVHAPLSQPALQAEPA